MFIEPQEDSGTSVTNAMEYLATRITDTFNLDPIQIVWVEHYGPWREGGETFDLVTFVWRGHQATCPRWRRTSREAVETLIGKTLSL